MAFEFRGAINIANAFIQQSDDGVSFVVSVESNHKFRLRADNEKDRQRWLIALEEAKKNAPQPYHYGTLATIPTGNPDGDISHDDENSGFTCTDAERNELESSFQALNNKFKQLSFSYESVLNHSNMLNESLTEFENVQSTPCETAIKTMNERSTSYKGPMNGVINNCQDFINLAQTYKGFLQPEHEISQL